MRGLCRLTVAGLTVLTLAGCGLLYTDVRAARAYRSATPSDVRAAPGDPTVPGQSCYQTVLSAPGGPCPTGP